MAGELSELEKVLDIVELKKVFKDFSVTTDLAVMLHDGKGNLLLSENHGNKPVCEKARLGEYSAKCTESIRYGGQKSLELGEPYMYSCACGLIMCSVPIAQKNKILGSITCGPLLLWEVDEVAVKEFFEKTDGMFASTEQAKGELEKIKQLQCVNLTGAAHLLYIVASYMVKSQNEYLSQRSKITKQQNEIANMLLEKKLSAKHLEIYEQAIKLKRYPLNLEKELIAYVQMGDRTASKRILNNLLGEIFSFSSGNLDVMKARLLELISILSRAAVDSGAPFEAITGNTAEYVRIIMEGCDFERLCFETSVVLDRFMNTVYEFRQQKKNSLHLTKAIAYINENYQNELSLETVAKNIFVSSYYLSHLFREEMDMTFSDYVLSVRMERAKLLLKQANKPVKDICFEVGFNDANYFAKAFKKAYGISPKNYRNFCN